MSGLMRLGLGAVFLCAGCAVGKAADAPALPIASLPETVMEELRLGRLPVPQTKLIEPQHLFRLALPKNAPYRLSRPSALAFGGGCKLYVADRLDQAVHVFDRAGSYLHSLDLPGMTGSTEASATAVAATGGGAIVIALGQRRELAIISDDTASAIAHLEGTGGSDLAHGTSVAVTEAGLLLEAIVGQPMGGLPALEAVVAKWSLRGEPLGAFGRHELLEGEGALLRSVNQGEITATTEAVWFLRNYDGSLFRYRVADGVVESDSVIRLPLLYPLRSPQQTVAEGRIVLPLMDEHARGLAASTAGLYVGMTIEPGKRWGLLYLGSHGDTEMLEVPGPVRAIAVGAGKVWVVHTIVDEGRTAVSSFMEPRLVALDTGKRSC